MKIDMRCSEKRITSPLGTEIYTVAFVSRLPFAQFEIEVDEKIFDQYIIGKHYAIVLTAE